MNKLSVLLPHEWRINIIGFSKSSRVGIKSQKQDFLPIPLTLLQRIFGASVIQPYFQPLLAIDKYAYLLLMPFLKRSLNFDKYFYDVGSYGVRLGKVNHSSIQRGITFYERGGTHPKLYKLISSTEWKKIEQRYKKDRIGYTGSPRIPLTSKLDDVTVRDISDPLGLDLNLEEGVYFLDVWFNANPVPDGDECEAKDKI